MRYRGSYADLAFGIQGRVPFLASANAYALPIPSVAPVMTACNAELVPSFPDISPLATFGSGCYLYGALHSQFTSHEVYVRDHHSSCRKT